MAKVASRRARPKRAALALPALEVTSSEAERGPGAPVGWNCTIRVQVDPAGSVVPQLPPATTANSVGLVPPLAAASEVAGLPLGLFTMKDTAVLMAPAVTAPKSLGVGVIN